MHPSVQGTWHSPILRLAMLTESHHQIDIRGIPSWSQSDTKLSPELPQVACERCFKYSESKLPDLLPAPKYEKLSVYISWLHLTVFFGKSVFWLQERNKTRNRKRHTPIHDSIPSNKFFFNSCKQIECKEHSIGKSVDRPWLTWTMYRYYLLFSRGVGEGDWEICWLPMINMDNV